MSVTINMTHTCCGDMLFNLRAPNGSIPLLINTSPQQQDRQVLPEHRICQYRSAPPVQQHLHSQFTAHYRNIPAPMRSMPISPVCNGSEPGGFVSNAANFAALYSSAQWRLDPGHGRRRPGRSGYPDHGPSISPMLPQLTGNGVWSPTTGLFYRRHTGNCIHRKRSEYRICSTNNYHKLFRHSYHECLYIRPAEHTGNRVTRSAMCQFPGCFHLRQR